MVEYWTHWFGRECDHVEAGLAGVLEPGRHDALYETSYVEQAHRFARTVTRFVSGSRRCISGRLNALAAEFEDLARRRALLASARPSATGAQSALTNGGVVGNNATLMEMCEAFEGASRETLDLSHRLRFSREPATVATLKSLNLRRLQHREIGVAAATECLLPLIALGRIIAAPDACAYAAALEKLGILDGEEAGTVRELVGRSDPALVRGSRATLEELWSGARSPGVLGRAVVHRALRAGKVTAELGTILPGDASRAIPIVPVDGAIISISTPYLSAWGEDELLIDLEGRDAIANTGARITIAGKRVVGNERAIRLAPWLVDERAQSY